MNKATLGILLLGATAAVSAASAKDILINVSWSGATPTDAYVDTPGGVEALTRDDANSMFRGSISIPEGPPQRRTITVRYGNYYHPFDIRVPPLLPRVGFTVVHQVQRSCTRSKVEAANTTANDLVDAIRRSVNAGELLSIEEPNACDKNLRFQATQAKFRQNAVMAEKSNGLFLMNRQIEKEYKATAHAQGISVDAEIASLGQRDGQLEVGQLLAFRAAALGIGDYASAIQVNNYMKSRVQSDEATAAIYKNQGFTKARLDADETMIATYQRFQAIPGVPGPTWLAILTGAQKQCRERYQCQLDTRIPCPPC